MPVYRDLRARMGYTKTAHHDFLLLLRTLYNNLLNNPHFRKPPVSLALFKTKIEEYAAAITATMGGAKIAFGKRDSLREKLMGMYKLLAAYVEHESHNDPQIFATSGLEALPNARVPAQPLDRPRISRVEHGDRPGELKVWMPPSYRKIAACDLRHVAVDGQDLPIGDWTEIPVARFEGPVTIKKLKPGTRYALQVRALGKLGKTDWSDSVIKMCT
jgi:hypothetical protein